MKSKTKPRPRTPKSRTFNRTQLASKYGVSLQTIDSWTRRGCPYERREGGGYVFKLDQVRIWRARALMLPWSWLDRVPPGPDTELVVGVDEYMRESKIDGDELLVRLAFGLPTLPPAPGKKGARISLPHARAWLLMFSGFVESVGGDGYAKDIAHEAQRLRGFPIKRDVGDCRTRANDAEHAEDTL
jgi:hypothetical protein